MGEHVRGEKNKREIGIFVHMQPWKGGSYQYVEFIFDAFLSCLKQYNVTVLYIEEEWEHILQLRYEKFSFRKIAFAYDRMIDEIDSIGFDYLVVPTYGPDFFYELGFKTPLISVIHDMMYYYQPKGSMWSFKESSYLYQGQLRRSIGVFVDSELGKQHCLHALGHMYESSLYVLPFRVPNYLYEKKEKRIKLKNMKYFFYPAQMFQIKNHINLLLSIYFLKSKGIKVNFLFTGKSNRRYEYKDVCDLIRVLGIEDQVEIIDYVNGPEMKYLFSNARAMIMPTFAGPTNIPPIEAMFVGCPVAVSDIFAMPEQIGEAGLCFDPRSIKDISSVLERLWTDDSLCRELSLRGKEQVKRYSKEIFNQCFQKNILNMIHNYEKENKDMIELAKICRKHRSIYLYGAGEIGFLVGNYLQKQFGISIDGYIVTKKMKDENMMIGVPIYQLSDIETKLKDSLIVLSLDEKYHESVKKNFANIETSEHYLVTEKHRIESWIYYTKTH